MLHPYHWSIYHLGTEPYPQTSLGNRILVDTCMDLVFSGLLHYFRDILHKEGEWMMSVPCMDNNNQVNSLYSLSTILSQSHHCRYLVGMGTDQHE